MSFAGRLSIRRSSQSQTAYEPRLLNRSATEQRIIKAATIRRCCRTDLALTPAPMNDPMLNAAKNVVIRLAQTKIELPKNGASTREATSCNPMLSIPSKKTRRKRSTAMAKQVRSLKFLRSCFA